MERGQQLFADGKFTEAVAEFSAAYSEHRFSAFLFNAAVAAERIPLRDQAIDYYGRFLSAEPSATDRVQIESTIARLKAESAQNASAVSASSQKAGIKSLIFIESEPSGAPVAIYEQVDPKAPRLDPTKPTASGYRLIKSGLKAPANISLGTGTYFVLVSGFEDYNPTGSQFTLEPGRVYVYRAGLSQGDFVGRVEISVPTSTAQIYVDDPPPHAHAPRATGTNAIELSPGKHTVWIDAVGFEPYQATVNIVQGKTIPLAAELKRLPYGYLVVTSDIDESEIEVGGETVATYLAKREPVRLRLPAGEYRVAVDASGRKEYEDVLVIAPGQEVALRAKLEPSPGRGGAVVTALLAAGTLAGGIVLNRYWAASGAGIDQPVRDVLEYSSYGLLASSGLLAVTSIILFVHDPEDDSTATVSPAREFTGEAPALPSLKGQKPLPTTALNPWATPQFSSTDAGFGFGASLTHSW